MALTPWIVTPSIKLSCTWPRNLTQGGHAQTVPPAAEVIDQAFQRIHRLHMRGADGSLAHQINGRAGEEGVRLHPRSQRTIGSA